MRWRWMRIFPALALLVGLTACATGSADRSRASIAAASRALPLAVFKARTPPVGLPNYHTSGFYPQVSDGRSRLEAVNAELRNAVLRRERSYAAHVRREYADWPALFRPSFGDHGTFKTSLRADLISASTVVVSALMPVREVIPGGNGGANWVSVTVQVPSGVPVRIGALFKRPTPALRAIAKAARRNVLANNRCIRKTFWDPIVHALHAQGFMPKPSNYRYFALTPRGLAIGFQIEQVGGPQCGRAVGFVPYAVVRPYLSELGRKLVAGVRAPRK
jgi:hypothetical protein